MNALFRRVLATGAGITLTATVGAAAWAQTDSSAAGSAPQPHRTIQMVQAQAQLDNTLDTKKAKQGEAVTAKLMENVQVPDAQPLPKNTVLEGHVEQVRASDHKSDSMMVITFDKAKMKDGQEVPIKATVIAMTEPQSMQQAGSGAPASAGPPMTSASPSASDGAPSGGGSMSTPSAPSLQPMSVPQAGSGQQQAQQNGVPDVALKSDIHQHNSATLMSKGRNVHVPDGTQLQLAIAEIPAGVTIQ